MNTERSSAGRALVELQNIVDAINPEPEDPDVYRAPSLNEKLNHAFEKMFGRPNYSWIEIEVYDAHGDLIETRPGALTPAQRNEILSQVKAETKRVKEYMTHFGTRLVRRHSIWHY